MPTLHRFFCALFAAFTLTSCATFLPSAQTQVGAEVIAATSNKVIAKGLDAGAVKIDTGNPYLHSLAQGLRANEGKVLTAADVQQIAFDYGDPHNKTKFKTLALDAWRILAAAALKIGWSAATEYVAQGLQAGAVVKP